MKLAILGQKYVLLSTRVQYTSPPSHQYCDRGGGRRAEYLCQAKLIISFSSLFLIEVEAGGRILILL